MRGIVARSRALALAVCTVSTFGGLVLKANPAQASSLVQCKIALLSFGEWIQMQESIATERMMRNISPDGAARGAVVASPQRSGPNYWYHWIRDAALVMNTVIDLYERAQSPGEKRRYMQHLMEFARFSRQNQTTFTKTDLGEPKFEADGSAYNDPWGRPQNDGPALRAVTLMRLARILLENGERQMVHDMFYKAELPATSVIKADLEYVSHHWRETNFDLWEEVAGDHFYTLMVQRRAMLEGAQFAALMNDEAAASWYREQGKLISERLQAFYDQRQNMIVVSQNRWQNQMEHKTSDVDIAVILGVHHAYRNDGFFTPTDSRVMATALKIEDSFATVYQLNKNEPHRVPLIGRYPQDTYSGNDAIKLGNPWVLTTHAMAEFYFRFSKELMQMGRITVDATNREFIKRLVPAMELNPRADMIVIEGGRDKRLQQIADAAVARGDEYLKRVRDFLTDGSMAEQIDRNSGAMVSARDLTWSYASFLTAIWSRPGTF